jgi:hypothetical protein
LRAAAPIALGAVVLLLSLSAACRAPSPSAQAPSPTFDAANLADRIIRIFEARWATDIDAPIDVTAIEPVTWPDNCLGTMRPATACAQRATAGYRVGIRVNKEMTYELRTDIDLTTVLWIESETLDGVIRTLEPGLIVIQGEGLSFERSEIPGFVQAAIVPGTQFLTPMAQLSIGQRVKVATNGWPSSGFPVLVWVVLAY